LIQREADGLRDFDISIEGFWHSFAAIVLTTPAFIALLAERRLASGLGPGLFDDPGLALGEGFAYLAAWFAFWVSGTKLINYLMRYRRRWVSQDRRVGKIAARTPRLVPISRTILPTRSGPRV
jgi:hypothetical protein